MIIEPNLHGPCTLDRVKPFSTWASTETHAFVFALAAQLDVYGSDVIEGLVRAAKSDAAFLDVLKHHALCAANENKKYPKELPPMLPPTEPELTPEVAYELIDPELKEFYRQEDLKAPPSEKPKQEKAAPVPQGPNLWTDLAAALTARVSEENFDRWLCTLRFVSTEEIDEANARLVLQVPNSFFQEYLAENYTAVIQEVLAAKYNQLFQIEFVVLDAKKEELPSPAPVETTQSQTPTPPTNTLLALIVEAKVETIDQLDALEDRKRPKMFQARLLDAERRAAGSGNQARLAAEVAILEDQRKKQEAAFLDLRKRRGAAYKMYRTINKLRESGNPQSQRQYSRPSHFDTEGGATRADLKDASRAMKTPGKRDLS
jgi:hypothetical protein